MNLNFYHQNHHHHHGQSQHLEDNRFTRSSLNKNKTTLSSINQKGRTSRKRTQSEVYVFHSKDIDKEIVKMLIQSTDSFISDFKRHNQCSHDSQLVTSHKEAFLPCLKDFLTNEMLVSDKYYDRAHHLEIGVTLSEPLISDINECRAKSEKESKLTESHSESLFSQSFFITNSIDSSGNVTNESHLYGSLPNSTFFDLYSPKKTKNKSKYSIDESMSKISAAAGKQKAPLTKNIINEGILL